MKFKSLLSFLPLTVFLNACEEKSSQIGCSNEVAQSALIELINKEAYKVLSNEVAEFSELTSQNKRSALDLLKLSFSEVVTTSKDSNSTLKSCEATISLTIPSDTYMTVADIFRENSGGNLDRHLEDMNLQQKANVFSKRVEYTVQPTDDAKTVFVKTLDNDLSSAMGLISAFVAVKPILEQQKRERAEKQRKEELELKKQQEKIAKETQYKEEIINQPIAVQQVEPVQNTAELPTMSLSEARSLYLAQDTELNRIWSTLTKEQKKSLLPAQKQWIKSKDAICGKTSMKGSDIAMIEMFKCQTEMTESRIKELY
ncbi:lysozyme inhibitor LprI family protein [Mannheimia indoligenes]|uniref:Lysozyme inhibitor LprI family protein n=1 Tax=Mannheimia indoligenes TaxID=3103145 RepID=A0ABU7ZBL0_9PAST